MAHSPHSDKILGLNESISGCDFIDWTLVASTVVEMGAAYPCAVGAQSPGASPGERSGYDPGASSAEWSDDASRCLNGCKSAALRVDTDLAGTCLPGILTAFADSVKPGMPAPSPASGARAMVTHSSGRLRTANLRTDSGSRWRSGFDAKRDIAGIVMNRFGHAFINPQPGFFFGLDGKPAARDAIRNGPFGRIAFSHSDLTGAMDHRNAFMESHRAVGQLLDRVLT